jgi:DNA-binding transcriptional ArsR family regulator
MSHRQLRSADRLDLHFAGAVADTMQALAAPSRVRILGRLRTGALSVGELAEAVETSATSAPARFRTLSDDC